MDGFGQIVERLIRDGDRYSAEWRRKILDKFAGIAERETAAGNKSILLDPMNVPGLPLEDYSAVLARYLLPVILSKDPQKWYESLETLFASDGIVGLGRHKLRNSAGSAITYMHEHIGHIFPLRDEVVEMAGDRVSCKYYLPLLYRYLEETEEPHPAAFAAERQWVKLLHSDFPVGSFTFRDQSGEWMQIHKTLMEFGGAPKTGVTAALLELGVTPRDIPFPIEYAAEDLGQATHAIRTELTGFDKMEVRQFGVNHPSGSWYISVVQFIVDGRLVIMIHDLTRYMLYGLSEKGRLSPIAVMAQLCYSAWLLEKRGIGRSKWVYSILRRYREKLCAYAAGARAEKEKYILNGTPAEWPFHYFRRSKQLYV